MITYAYLETTNYCNLDCSFCNRKDVIGPLQHISLTNWNIILQKLCHHPITEAKLMGMGEPFFHPQFDKITKTFKKIFPKAFTISSTNCQYNISNPNKNIGRIFQRSLKYIDLLYLSIDGYRDNYEKDRSPATWKKLIEFLDSLCLYNRYNCQIAINYVVNIDNVYDIPDIERLVKRYNLQELRLNLVQCWDQQNHISECGYTKRQIQFLKKYAHLIKGRPKWTWSDCFWVDSGVYITVNGDIKICCMNTSAKSIGNIFSDSIDEVHQQPQYTNIQFGCSINQPTDHCKTCSYKELVPLLNRVL